MKSMRGTTRSGAPQWLIALALLAQTACGSDDPKGPGKALVLSTTTVVINAERGHAVAAEHVTISATGEHVVDGLVAAVVYPAEAATGWLTATVADNETPSVVTLQAVTTDLAP